MTLKLDLLGSPTLHAPGGSVVFERKTAAVLTYLALEGGAPKYRLAGMLWPGSGEVAARNNMRQLLRRLRLAGAAIVVGNERIELLPAVEVDVARLSFPTAPPLELLRCDADLLEGFAYDDAPDFAAWLDDARAELRALRARSADLEAARLERAGDFRAALDYVGVFLKLEPFAEEGHRRAMRLHYLLGDRAAALAAFERCKEILAREFGAEPMPETLEVARLIERGALAGAPAAAGATALPAAVLRPPVLVGRERAWTVLEEAWRTNKVMLVTGAPGIGKTRFVEEFAASKGASCRIDGRPGDTEVPYASQRRVLRELLARRPELSPRSGHLEPWIWHELARLLPELGAAPPVHDPSDRLRFFEAVGRTLAYCTRDLDAVIVDDLQFYDDRTVEMAAYYHAQPYAQDPAMPPHITAFRRGELSAQKQALVDRFVDAGVAVLIDLEPLPEEAIGTLLAGLGLRDGDRLVSGLARYTGGNPLFILETLKHLIETDTLDLGLPARLAPPGTVAALIRRRLGGLSPLALHLARVAAVAGTSFTMRLAARVLERPALELAEAHAELEAAQILRGNAFTHDVVFETLAAELPQALAGVLHGRTAAHLETVDADPALVALHLLEAGDARNAAPHLVRASERARTRFQFEEARRLRERAAEIYEAHGAPAARLDALGAEPAPSLVQPSPSKLRPNR